MNKTMITEKIKKGKFMTNDNLDLDVENGSIDNDINSTDVNSNVEQEINNLAPQEEELITISKQKLEKLIKSSKFKGIQKGKREMLNMQQNQDDTNTNSVESSKLTESQIKNMIADYIPAVLEERAEIISQQQIAREEERLAKDFISKMQPVFNSNPEIGEILMNDINYDDVAMKQLIYSATNLENTSSVMQELLQNPQKLASLQSLFREQPKLAERQLHSLSSSIKKNEEASTSVKNTKEPLSQLKSSASAGMNTNSMSVKDFARQHMTRDYRK